MSAKRNSQRPKFGGLGSRAAGLTPAVAASDLIRIATMTGSYTGPGTCPVQILADGTSRQLSRSEAARTMTILAFMARAFAAALPREKYELMLLDFEDIFSGPSAVDVQLDTLASEGNER